MFLGEAADWDEQKHLRPQRAAVRSGAEEQRKGGGEAGGGVISSAGVQTSPSGEAGSDRVIDRRNFHDLQSEFSSWMWSVVLFQESFGKLEEFINTCRGRFSVPLDPALRTRGSLIHPYISSLPEASVDVYMSMQQQGLESVQRLQSVQVRTSS